MFSIKSVTVTDFRSFRGTHVWAFPEAAGLYQLTGKNLENPKLGRNGVGKSSLLDAILWCDYGKTSKGLRANDVVARDVGSGACCVVVEHVVWGEQLVVKRTQNPNSLTLNGKVVDQEQLNKALNRNYEAFCYSGIIPQGRDMFFDLSPASKLTLFSEIMGLDGWLELSQKAFNEQRSLEAEKQRVERLLSVCEGLIVSLTKDVNELKIKADKWADMRSQQINELEVQRGHSKVEADLKKADVARIDATIADLSKSFDEEVQTRKAIEAEAKLNVENIDEINKELALVQRDIKLADKSIEQLQQLGPVCPVCDQRIDKAHMSKHLNKLRAELRAFMADQEELLFMRETTVKEQRSLYEQLNNFAKEDDLNKRHMHTLKGERAVALNEVKHNEEEIKKIDKQVAKLKDQPNEFDLLKRMKQAELIQKTGEKNKHETAIIALNEQIAAVTYWVGGFKRIRLMIIEETLRSLEVEVNNNLVQLGLDDWRIEFDVERENKSGGVTKGFTVLVYDPKHEEPIKWESFSAGETQLLKLAGSLGLANLICERAGLDNKVEFFDEASDHLSTEPINSLCETLNERAINSGRQVWVIDHSAIDYGDFAGAVTVVKDENGSRMV